MWMDGLKNINYFVNLIEKSNNYFNRPGIINLEEFDNQYHIVSNDAIDWLKKLNKHGKNLLISPVMNIYIQICQINMI